MGPTNKEFGVVGFIRDYESGLLSEDQIIDGFQVLVDTGLAWSLQGHYGRAARALIEAGYITENN